MIFEVELQWIGESAAAERSMSFPIVPSEQGGAKCRRVSYVWGHSPLRGPGAKSPVNFQKIEAILKHFPDTWSK